MVVLRQVEKDLPGVGIALLHEFFPDHTLRDAEKTEWDALKASVKQRRAFELFERYECEDAVDREGLEVDMRCSELSWNSWSMTCHEECKGSRLRGLHSGRLWQRSLEGSVSEECGMQQMLLKELL
jgi:hypothetical protein